MAKENGVFDPAAENISRGRAVGLMQVTKGALRDVQNETGVQYGMDDLKDPKINTLIGSLYWRLIYDDARRANATEGEAIKIAAAGFFAGRTAIIRGLKSAAAVRQELTAANAIANIIPAAIEDKKTGVWRDAYTLKDVTDYLSVVLGNIGSR